MCMAVAGIPWIAVPENRRVPLGFPLPSGAFLKSRMPPMIFVSIFMNGTMAWIAPVMWAGFSIRCWRKGVTGAMS